VDVAMKFGWLVGWLVEICKQQHTAFHDSPFSKVHRDLLNQNCCA